uniref:Uncharacterized protein n=1 Tax=Picea glauca TaxID=3330 RepID=A0A101LZ05_PICGL|nr:hypothetical protein ABT39_MTgene4969 [Picea glauca]QHR90402.1 hypothetical protein Q903MT_gene4425 [Picea sitchensis]
MLIQCSFYIRDILTHSLKVCDPNQTFSWSLRACNKPLRTTSSLFIYVIPVDIHPLFSSR